VVSKSGAEGDTAVLAEALRKPLYDGFPEMSLAELRMRGESWMKQGRYLEAAEARRRLLVIESTNPSLARDLGVALFAAERYELASIALNEALDRDPRVLASLDLSSDFGSTPAFEKTMTALERHVVKNSNDGSARFVLGVMDLSSGRYFAARNEFSLLKEAAPQNPHVGNLLAESDKKLLEAVPVEAPAETAPATR
jgi:tetratricopeptide (TPR) repeat protein